MKKKEIKELIRYMRFEHKRVNLKYKNSPMIHLTCHLQTMNCEIVEINPFEFNLKTGVCHGFDLDGVYIEGRFW